MMTLKARDIMRGDAIVTVSPDMTVGEFKRMLVRDNISAAPVVDAVGHLVGLVSQRDVIKSLDSKCSTTSESTAGVVEELLAQTVGEIMNTQLHTVTPDTDLSTVAKVLRRHRIHRVLVVEGKTLVGIISTVDFVRTFEDPALVAEIAKWKPWTPFRHAREEHGVDAQANSQME